MDENKKLMDEEIRDKLEQLGETPILSEAYSNGVNDISTLYKLRIEETKVETERKKVENERLKNETDALLRIAGIVLEGIGIGAPLMFYAYWMRQGFTFEKEGYISSFTFKDLIGNFKPRKR